MMRPIDADALFDEAFKVWGTEADGGETNLFMEMINNAPTITPPPNDPLTLDQLREMAWSQSPVWCSDADGIHAGLMCIRDDWYAPERTPHIWLLDEEGNIGVYSVKTLLNAGAKFYRRKPEEGKS